MADAQTPPHRRRPPSPSGPRPQPLHLRPEHLYKAVALLFLLALVYRFFTELSQVLLVLYATAILATLLNPLAQRLPLGRRWVAGLFGLLLFAALGVLVWLGLPVLLNQARELAARTPQLVETVNGWEDSLRRSLGMQVNLIGPETPDRLREALFGGGNILGGMQGLLQVVLLTFLVLVGALFALAKPNERLLSPALRVFPRDLRPDVRRMMELLGDRLMGWLKGTLIDMVAVGGLYIAAFYLIGIPNALLLGALNGVLVFIPLLGPWVGGFIATAVAFLVDPTKALWTIVAVIAIQQFEQNVIVPTAYSRAADVHPLVTLFALFLFGALFGFLGILLAVPLVLFFWTAVQVLWVERTIETDHDHIAPMVEE